MGSNFIITTGSFDFVVFDSVVALLSVGHCALSSDQPQTRGSFVRPLCQMQTHVHASSLDDLFWLLPPPGNAATTTRLPKYSTVGVAMENRLT